MVTKGETAAPSRRMHRLQEMPWNSIDRPGCYMLVGSGDLIRVPQDALFAGHSPIISITSNGETRVARLSDNPATPISVLRNIAADNDFNVNF